MLLLDGPLEGTVVVLSAVEVNAGVPPELVDGEGAENHVGVVQLMVVADVRADESPGGFHGGISAETGLLLGLAAYISLIRSKRKLPRAGRLQRFLGARRAMEGV